MKADPDKLIVRVNNAYELYRAESDKLARYISSHVDWSDDISCEYIPGDGLCVHIGDEWQKIAPVAWVISAIKDFGNISKSDYDKMCI